MLALGTDARFYSEMIKLRSENKFQMNENEFRDIQEESFK